MPDIQRREQASGYGGGITANGKEGVSVEGDRRRGSGELFTGFTRILCFSSCLLEYAVEGQKQKNKAKARGEVVIPVSNSAELNAEGSVFWGASRRRLPAPRNAAMAR